MRCPVFCFLGPIAWRVGKRHDVELSPKTFLIELHRFATVSIKVQVGDDLFHDLLKDEKTAKTTEATSIDR